MSYQWGLGPGTRICSINENVSWCFSTATIMVAKVYDFYITIYLENYTTPIVWKT